MIERRFESLIRPWMSELGFTPVRARNWAYTCPVNEETLGYVGFGTSGSPSKGGRLAPFVGVVNLNVLDLTVKASTRSATRQEKMNPVVHVDLIDLLPDEEKSVPFIIDIGGGILEWWFDSTFDYDEVLSHIVHCISDRGMPLMRSLDSPERIYQLILDCEARRRRGFMYHRIETVPILLLLMDRKKDALEYVGKSIEQIEKMPINPDAKKTRLIYQQHLAAIIGQSSDASDETMRSH